jgi:hypothetical protein
MAGREGNQKAFKPGARAFLVPGAAAWRCRLRRRQGGARLCAAVRARRVSGMQRTRWPPVNNQHTAPLRPTPPHAHTPAHVSAPHTCAQPGVEGIVLLFSANDGSGPVFKFPAYDYFAPVLEPILQEVRLGVLACGRGRWCAGWCWGGGTLVECVPPHASHLSRLPCVTCHAHPHAPHMSHACHTHTSQILGKRDVQHIIRLQLALMKPGVSDIKIHVDSGGYAIKGHRIHIPIFTHPKVRCRRPEPRRRRRMHGAAASCPHRCEGARPVARSPGAEMMHAWQHCRASCTLTSKLR